jgi:hypothetical protein
VGSMRRSPFFPLFVLAGAAAGLVALGFGCSAKKGDEPLSNLDTGNDTADEVLDTDNVFDVQLDANKSDVPFVLPDPKTCEEAAANKSYVGCDFWPTVVANSVWETFDFTAVVANAGDTEVKITATGPGGFVKEAIAGPGRLVKVYLPWVKELKGKEADTCGRGSGLDGTVRVDKGAYHITTDLPVAIYQFNALEYKGAGGAPGKSWASCPGNKTCVQDDGSCSPACSAGLSCVTGFCESLGSIGCFSFTNDASLLLPSTALTGNYRITGAHGGAGASPYIAITGTHDGTDVTLTLGSKTRILAGGGIPYTGSGVLKLSLGAGDVIELVGSAFAGSDFSGSIVAATKPVQVIAGVPCIEVPAGTPACDHLEETVFPAETMGQRYAVVTPTGPNGNNPGQVVRFFGNEDGTTLSYYPLGPKGGPTTLNAGQVVEVPITTTDFVVQGDKPFAVATLMVGGKLADPAALGGEQKGDPSLSMVASVEQYRLKYVFLAPDDYLVSYADVVAPSGTKLKLDGDDVTDTPTKIPTTEFEVYRIKLPTGTGGSHTLTSTKPVGLQVLGYGLYTSYQYPGGLNLALIAAPPK